MEQKTVFLGIFGTSPLMRVLDFLVVNEEFDYSMKDIARLSGVGYATLKLMWPRLERNQIIRQTRTIGKAKMYRLNRGNLIIRKFKDFYWDITKQAVGKEAKQEILA